MEPRCEEQKTYISISWDRDITKFFLLSGAFLLDLGSYESNENLLKGFLEAHNLNHQ